MAILKPSSSKATVKVIQSITAPETFAPAAFVLAAPENQEDLEWREIINPPKFRGRKRTGLHLYSQTIAERLNTKQADIAGGALAVNLYYWQRGAKKAGYKQTLIDGRRYAFRSLSDMVQDCPYLSRSAIAKAVNRLEHVFKDDFLVRRDKSTLWFHMSDSLTQAIEKGRFIRFLVADAVRFGNIRAAVLTSNMRYALSEFKNPKEDEVGNKYVEISPRTLAPILHFSEDTISRAMKDLCDKHQEVIRHPDGSCFYAFKTESDKISKARTEDANANNFVVDCTAEVDESAKLSSAEVNGDAAEVDSSPAEVDVNSAEVDDYLRTYSNQNGNELVKGSNDYISPLAATPQRPVLHTCTNERMLNLATMASQHSAKILSALKERTPVDQSLAKNHCAVLADEIDPDWSLDFIICPETASNMESAAENAQVPISQKIHDVIIEWKSNKFPFAKEDRSTLKKFFEYNRHMSGDDLLKVWWHTWYAQNATGLTPGKWT